MPSNALRTAQLAVVVLGLTGFALTRAHAQGGEDVALAAALAPIKVTLQDGLKSAESDGKPISAKFEIEEGHLQLSLYTLKGEGFDEVIVDLKTGAVASSKKITDEDDLKAAAAQKAAMGQAKISLLAATDKALSRNPESRAVSIFPALESGKPVAEVSVLHGGNFIKASEKLD
jgi:hypothetical protein